MFNITATPIFFAGSFLTLGHEYMTEGYLFAVADVLNFQITHEKFVILLLFLGLFFAYKALKRRGGGIGRRAGLRSQWGNS
jgi:hypothetical protein